MGDKTKRQYECERKREYRTKLRTQRDILAAEVTSLEHTLARLSSSTARQPASQKQQRRPATHSDLRKECHRQRELLRKLYLWALYCAPQLHPATPWLNSTLLADPTARTYGYQWLTDRVFYSTQAALPFQGDVGDMARLQLHTDDWDVLGIETSHQSTLLVDMEDAARCAWERYTLDEYAHVKQTSSTDRLDDDIVYKRLHDHALGTSLYGLVRRYTSLTRTVFVVCMLSHDDCFPLAATELRPHGFGWIVMERMADGVTLQRTRMMQFSPITTSGHVPLERVAAMFGVDSHPTSRHVTLARVETTALRNFIRRRDNTDQDLLRRIERSHVSDQ
ncbi:Aste57867_20504 [Aphanomyces stellatus]|uniref:Aste57867_20504 protein n=1 Tax=Aphanomyces stellatus TaxID=120398 RepID=A0A485LH52_9STRA|nr:hypothetical protein As57867_020438 [Aphanomyces stellatus]VFT97189.1 Aste57867_20504 [Aphanomyces stellatus]